MPSVESSEWYIARNGQQVGPIPTSQIELFRQSGRLLPTDDVWSAELGEWKKASKVFRFVPPPPPSPTTLVISEAQTQGSVSPVSSQSFSPLGASNPLGKVFQWMGILAIIGSVIWWAVFFSAVANAVSGGGRRPPPLSGAVECLFHSGGACGVVGGLARLVGYSPYQPLVFWLGVISLVFGILYRLFATPVAVSQSAAQESIDDLRIYDRNGRTIIRRKNGSIIVIEGSQYTFFPSIADYRKKNQDATQWDEITDPVTKQAVLSSVPASAWTL